MVKKQGEMEEVAGGFNRILKACRDLQRILRRFLEMRALPRCAAESSICSINYNSPPPSPLPYSATCFLSMAPLYVSEIQESTFSTTADAISYNLHPSSHHLCLHPIQPHIRRHTPPQTIPCGYLDVLSIRK